MADSWASSDHARRTMLANRRRDTKPELEVRRLVHAMGLRYCVDHAALSANKRSRADLVFTRAKVAVFIDGCFWHGCPQHHTFASTNAAYWRAKAEGNRARDERTNTALRDGGWTVLRFWEHQDPHTVADAIRKVVLSVR